MKEALKKVVPDIGQLHLKSVDLFVNSQLLSIAGDWQWDLHSDNIFCTDVIISLPPDYVGTKGIIHPDDLSYVREKLILLLPGDPFDIEFRMITTYNEVKKLTGKNCLQVAVDELKVSSPEKEILEAVARHRRFEKGHDVFHHLRNISDKAEIITKAGKWYNNTNTNETYYSDNIFRLHSLNPQSLNAHLNTFTGFIHPDDSAAVTEAFDKAYRDRVPVFLEYRIITANGTQKSISQTTFWSHNYKGELIVSGLMQDLTEVKATAINIEHAENDRRFINQLLQFKEGNDNTGHWRVNLLTRQIFYSDNYYRIHGLKPQSIPPAANIFNNYIHPDDREKVLEAFNKIAKEHIPPDIEYCIIRPDGKLRHVIQKGLLMSHGSELVMTGIIRDITAQKTAEQKLAYQEENHLMKDIAFNRSENIGGIGNWVQDLETGNTFWSDNMYEMFGYKKSNRELNYKTLLNSILPEERKMVSDEINLVMDGQEDREVEFRVLRVGEVRTVKANFKITDIHGKKFFTGTLQDITKHELLEQQLFEGTQLNELLAQNIIDSVFITDINNKIVLWNRKCEEVFRLKTEDVLNRNYFDALPQNKTEQVLTRFNNVLKGDLVREPAERINAREIYNLSMMPLRDKENKVVGILHVLHDVTKELQLHSSLKDRLNFIEKLLQETVDRIAVLDRNLNFVYWNKKAEEHYHINKEYILQKNLLQVFPNIINDPLYNSFRRALKGETVYIPSGVKQEDEHFETYLIPVKDDRENVTKVLWLAHDLSKEFEMQKDKTIAEEKVREQAYFLKRITETTPDMISILELETGRFTFLNSDTFKAHGFDPENIPQNKQQGTSQLIHPDDRDILNRYFKNFKGATDDDVISAEYRARAADGEWKWFFVRGRVFQRDENGKVTHILNAIENITNRKNAEQEVRESKDLLQAVFNASLAGIILFKAIRNDDGTISDFEVVLNNTVTQQWNGRDLTGKRYAEEFPVIRKYGILEGYSKVLETGEPMRMEVLYEGESFRNWFVITAVKLNDDELVAAAEDITERKKAEEELKENKLFVTEILNATPDFVMVFNLLTKKVEFVNQSAYQNDNKRYQETLQITYGELLSRAHPHDRQKLDEYIQHFMVAEDDTVYSLDYRVVKDNDVIWYRSRGKVFKRDEKGTPTHYITVIQDITELFRKEAEHQLDAVLLEKKDEFISIASHELRGPVANVKLSMHLLKELTEDTPGNETLKTVIERSARQANKIADLVNDLLDVTRIQEGKLILNKTTFNLTGAIKECKEEISSHNKNCDIQINGEELKLLADRNRIQQVITNFLSNAVKYSPKNKKITVLIEKENNQVKVSVSDKGIGISKEYLPRIFDRYFQVDGKSKKYTGLGLGLYISKEIIKKHGGEVGAVSEEGKGSTFWFTLPLHAV